MDYLVQNYFIPQDCIMVQNLQVLTPIDRKHRIKAYRAIKTYGHKWEEKTCVMDTPGYLPGDR